MPEPGSEPDLTAAAGQVRTLDQLGQLLRRLRSRHARRQGTRPLAVRELARRSGYAYGVVSEYLSGRTLASTDRFDVLVRLLGASPPEQRALATARDRVEDQRHGWRSAGRVPRELPPGGVRVHRPPDPARRTRTDAGSGRLPGVRGPGGPATGTSRPAPTTGSPAR